MPLVAPRASIFWIQDQLGNDVSKYELRACTSLWLITISFWDYFNYEYGVMFDHYEEELITPALASIVTDRLNGFECTA